MGSFVTDPDSTLPSSTRGTYINLRPLPPGEDPHNYVQAEDMNEVTARIDAIVVAAYDLRTVLLMQDNYTTLTMPPAGADFHRRVISVKDPGADEVLYFCRQKADNSYEWILVAF